MTLDPILLGHNPFFGTNHLDQAQGEARATVFENEKAILEVLRKCHDEGIRGMMMSTHPRAAVFCRLLEREGFLSQGWRIYPLVPYIQKYVRGANEKGLVNMVKSMLTPKHGLDSLSILWSGGRSLMTKDVRGILTTLIDVELLPFKGLPLGAVFLHDALTDLALGLGADSVLGLFRDHIVEKYRVPAGLTTKNLPTLRRRLAGMEGWSRPLIMVSANATGFYMNPSPAESEQVLQKDDADIVAMSTLASGALRPDQAYPYLAQFPAIKSVVVGLSRPDHITETVKAIRTHLPFARI